MSRLQTNISTEQRGERGKRQKMHTKRNKGKPKRIKEIVESCLLLLLSIIIIIIIITPKRGTFRFRIKQSEKGNEVRFQKSKQHV